MKCFGYTKSDVDTLAEISKVTFQANPEDLRRLASFFLQCADAIDGNPDWEHEHLNDSSPCDTDEVDVIVFTEQQA